MEEVCDGKEEDEWCLLKIFLTSSIISQESRALVAFGNAGVVVIIFALRTKSIILILLI